MRTSVVFLGVISTVFIVGLNAGLSKDSSLAIQPETVSASVTTNSPSVWKLSLSGEAFGCDIAVRAYPGAEMSLQLADNCTEILPALQEFANVETNPNGDITLYGTTGIRLVQFIESESSDFVSIWPQYPLMTLARVE